MKMGAIQVARDMPAFIQVKGTDNRRTKTTFLNLVFATNREVQENERGWYNYIQDSWHVTGTGCKKWMVCALGSDLESALKAVCKEESLSVMYQTNVFHVCQGVSWTTIRVVFSTEKHVDDPLSYVRALKKKVQRRLR